MECISLPSSQTTTFNYDGVDADGFIKKVIRMLYDKDVNDIIFIDGNKQNLTRDNIYWNEKIDIIV